MSETTASAPAQAKGATAPRRPLLPRIWRALPAWRDVVRELRWKLSPPYQSPLPPSFPTDPNLLARTRIRWPRTYQWWTAVNWGGALLDGLGRLVPVELVDLPQTFPGLICFEVVVDGHPHSVTLDYFDRFDVIRQAALERSIVYFKMQFHREGYASRKVVPGGFVSGTTATYSYIGPLRSAADRRAPLYDVYGRFGLTFAKEIRSQAVALLRDQPYFHYEGGAKLVRYSRSLADASRARICIDLPSNSDYCFRLVDYLAVGTAIIAVPHRTIMPVPLEDRKHLVYCRPDLTDLVELCRYYLSHDAERLALRQAAREYFDRYLHRDQLAGYYLSTCFSHLA